MFFLHLGDSQPLNRFGLNDGSAISHDTVFRNSTLWIDCYGKVTFNQLLIVTAREFGVWILNRFDRLIAPCGCERNAMHGATCSQGDGDDRCVSARAVS